MNGSTGIQPTVELATTNGAYPYPVMFGNNGGFGNGFGGEGALWLIVLLALIWGGNGNNGFGGFGNNFDDGYAWLSNGQKEIMQNTNNGFDTLHLSNQLEGTRNALNDIQSQICNSTFSINDSIKDGFYGLNTSFLNCCCENKLGIADLKSTIISENCADRQALNEGIRDVIASQVAGTEAGAIAIALKTGTGSDVEGTESDVVIAAADDYQNISFTKLLRICPRVNTTIAVGSLASVGGVTDPVVELSYLL